MKLLQKLFRKEDDLRTSANRAELLAAIVDSSDDAIISKTLDGIITSWNQGAEKLYGYTAQEAISQHITLVFPKELVSEEVEIIAKIKRGEKVDHYETKRLTKDGRLVDVSLMISPILDKQGNIIGASKIANNITNLKEIHERLRASEERLQLAVNGSADGLWDWNVVTGEVYFSPRFMALTGHAPEELPHTIETWIDLMHPDDREATHQAVQKYFKERVTYSVEYRLRHKDGHYVWCHARGQAVWNDKDEAIRMTGFTLDISERKQQEQLLIASNNLNATILSSARHLIISTDTQGKVTAFNKAAEKALGYSASETIGKTTPALWHDGDEVVARATQLTKELGVPVEPGFAVFTTKADMDIVVASEWTLIRKDKSRFPVSLTVTCIKEGLKIIGYLGVLEDISERKAAEHALKESEERFQLVSKGMSVGIWDWNITTGEMYWSQKLSDIFGITDLDFIPNLESFAALLHPDDKDRVLKALSAHLEHKGAYDLEYRLRWPDGRYKWIHAAGQALWDKDDRPFRMAGSVVDITERIVAQLHLQESEKFRTLVLETIPEYLFVKDADFRIVQANQNFLSLYPQSIREAVIGTTTIEHYTKEERDIFLEKDKEAFAKGAVEYEETIQFPDGEKRTLQTTKVRFFDAKNAPFILGISRDITERKKTEHALKVSEERYDLAMRGMSVGLWDWNVQTSELYWSQKFKDILGITDNDFLTHFDEYGNRLHPEDKEITLKILSDHLEHRGSFNVEYRLRHNNGQYIWIHAYGQAQWDKNGKPIRMAGSVDDISDEKQADLHRKKLLEKLTESNTELERFAYVASHDMQEPLRMIANFSELISKEYKDKLDAEGKEYIHLVNDAAIRMQHMVDDLLEYARVGNSETRLVTVSAAKELKHVLENLRIPIHESGAVVTFDNLPNIVCNPVQFLRLLQNLIGNGLKYQKEGTKPAVHVGIKDLGSEWCFSVRDNGIGMDMKYATKVFEPFKRLHTWEDYKGSGIGLSVCKKIIENHGGKIWMESKLGIGSTFCFTLPKSSILHPIPEL